MTDARWRISVTTPDWGQDHLSLDAVVAYVDDELAPGPHLRATQHLAQCRECAAQVVAQGQARAALRTADCPSMPSSLLSSLRSIPMETELPGPPAGLAVAPDGQLMSVLRPERVEPRREAARPHGKRPHRGLRFGTGVAVSGLAMGAIAFAMPTDVGGPAEPPTATTDSLTESTLRGVTPVDAHLRLDPGAAAQKAPAAGADAGGPAPSAPSSPPAYELPLERLDHIPGSFLDFP